MTRADVLRMIQRGAADVQLSTAVCCHSFRATGITAYLENGGTLEHAQKIAAHEYPRTTKLYDRTSDQITLDEIEKIAIQQLPRPRGKGDTVPFGTGAAKLMWACIAHRRQRV